MKLSVRVVAHETARTHVLLEFDSCTTVKLEAVSTTYCSMYSCTRTISCTVHEAMQYKQYCAEATQRSRSMHVQRCAV
jgi:hypothetical protein